jgi:hypothetical protein
MAREFGAETQIAFVSELPGLRDGGIDSTDRTDVAGACRLRGAATG